MSPGDFADYAKNQTKTWKILAHHIPFFKESLRPISAPRAMLASSLAPLESLFSKLSNGSKLDARSACGAEWRTFQNRRKSAKIRKTQHFYSFFFNKKQVNKRFSKEYGFKPFFKMLENAQLHNATWVRLYRDGTTWFRTPKFGWILTWDHFSRLFHLYNSWVRLQFLPLISLQICSFRPF